MFCIVPQGPREQQLALPLLVLLGQQLRIIALQTDTPHLKLVAELYDKAEQTLLQVPALPLHACTCLRLIASNHEFDRCHCCCTFTVHAPPTVASRTRVLSPPLNGVSHVVWRLSAFGNGAGRLRGAAAAARVAGAGVWHGPGERYNVFVMQCAPVSVRAL